MQPTQKPRVKTCYIGSMFEAQLAIQYAASVFGLICAKPGGPVIFPKT